MTSKQSTTWLIGTCIALMPLISSAQAVATRSTAVPISHLQVQNHLETSTNNLSYALKQNSIGMSNTAEQLAMCNAGITENGNDPFENVAYSECRSNALQALSSNYRTLAQDLTTYKDGLDMVVIHIADTMVINEKTMKQQQRTLKRIEYTNEKVTQAVRNIALNNPEGVAINVDTRLELGRLRVDLMALEQKNKIAANAIVEHQKYADELRQLNDNIASWKVDAEILAYEYDARHDIVNDLLQVSADAAQTQIMLSQISGVAIGNISKSIKQLRNIDINTVLNEYGTQAKVSFDAQSSINHLDPDNNQRSLETWLDTFRLIPSDKE